MPRFRTSLVQGHLEPTAPISHMYTQRRGQRLPFLKLKVEFMTQKDELSGSLSRISENTWKFPQQLFPVKCHRLNLFFFFFWFSKTSKHEHKKNCNSKLLLVSLCLQRGQGPSRKKIQPQPQLPHAKEEKASHLWNHSCDMTVKPDTGNIHAYTVTSAFYTLLVLPVSR